ncbi:ABC transporter substrate-binding protein [Inquilinus limosus]|uniref:ABC transporter substrate-binding protein n=1 Tax=Inquilinus limosus TaxID=171674 RepID=UPI000A79255D|nr:ABC transporter substrate-binding protein [Inquilinus limosus]
MTDRIHLNRRSLLGGSLAATAALTFGPGLARAEGTRLRLAWWGSQDRTRRTQAVIDLYQKKAPGVSIVGEAISGSAYWTKLSTQMAGRNISDVYQLEPRTISDYSGRGACMALDPFLSKTLKIDDFDPGTVDLCRIGGTVWGVALGLNSFSLFYDTTVFAKAGLPPPTAETTWTQYADLSVELTKALGKDHFWGSSYGARYSYVLDVWLRQRGKTLYSEDGQLGFGVEDAKEWYAYWEELRARGGCVGGDIQTQDQSIIETNPLSRGYSAMGFTYSNQLVGYQAMMPNKLGITMVPQAGGGAPSGHYYRPALIWSIGSTSKNGEAAAAFIDFFVNDLEAGRILGVERGVPPSRKVREAILPTLNETERASVEYVNALAGKVGAYQAPPPIGSQEFGDHLGITTDRLAFGQLSIADAAKQLVEQGNVLLRRR